jgi:hypothetical protein
MLFVTQLWLVLYLHPGEWPWLCIFLIFVQGFFFLDNAGKSLGLDALLARAPVGHFAGGEQVGSALSQASVREPIEARRGLSSVIQHLRVFDAYQCIREKACPVRHGGDGESVTPGSRAQHQWAAASHAL